MATSDSSQPSGFSLSPQERRLLDLSIQGASDETIALELGLDPLEVIAARLRLRARLGTFGPSASVPLNGVELQRRNAELLAEHRILLEQLLRGREELVQRTTTAASLKAESVLLLAFSHAPDALLLVRPPATIAFANPQAHRLFGAAPEGLVGLSTRELTHLGLPESLREPTRRLFQTDGPAQETFGIEQPFYARRRDGSSFRAIMQTDRFATPEGPFAVTSVREMLKEAETLVYALGRPLDLG